MTEFTEAQKEAMRQYKQPFIEKINELDIVDTLGLKKAHNGGFICPCCKSGSGSNATGAQVTKDHKRITCFANTDCPMNGNGHGQDVYGALQAVTGKTGDAILKEFFPSYNIADALKESTGRATEAAAASAPVQEKPLIFKSDSSVTFEAESAPVQEKPAERVKKPDYLAYYRACADRINEPAAREYLAQRGISEATAAAHLIGYDPQADPANAPGMIGDGYRAHPCPRLIIPFDRSHYMGRSILADTEKKYRKINNKKQGDNDSIPPFNVRALYNESGNPVFITEGAFDALSILEVGSEALALNSASNTRKIIERLKTKRTRSTLILCLDSDDAGKKAQEQLADGLSELNIPYITADICGDHKDPNEALTANYATFCAAVTAAERKISKPYNVADYIRQIMYSEIEKLKAQSDRRTGFPNLDAEAGGIYAGLYIVGGISSVGKTTFISQIADQMAALGQHVLFYSMEQSRLEIVSKSIARQTAAADPQLAVTSLQIRTGTADPKSVNRKGESIKNAIAAYLQNVGDRMSIIEGNFNCTVGFIKNYTKQYIEQNDGIKPVVIVDYLQVLQPEPDPITGRKMTDKRQIVDDNVTELKRLSRSLEIPIFVISSVNRNNYLTPIDFEAFKESGGIEYTADVVWGLQLAAVHDKVFDGDGKIKEKREAIATAKEAMPRDIELACLKNRYGKSRYSVQFTYYPQYDYFVPKK